MYMSLQECPDVCLIDGFEHPLLPSPLEAVIAALGVTPIRYHELCSACWRGCVARWELRDGALYLLAVDHRRGGGVRVDFATFEDLDMHEWSNDAMDLQEDPWGVVRPLPEACLVRVRGWLAGDRVAPLQVDWIADSAGAKQMLGKEML